MEGKVREPLNSGWLDMEGGEWFQCGLHAPIHIVATCMLAYTCIVDLLLCAPLKIAVCFNSYHAVTGLLQHVR